MRMDGAKKARLVLIGIGTIVDAWKLYLTLRNIHAMEKITPPPELEMSVGHFYMLTISVRHESYRILLSTILESIIRALRVGSTYYAYIWELSGKQEHTATIHAMRFAASDEIMSHGFCMSAFFFMDILMNTVDPFLPVISTTVQMAKAALIAAMYTYIRTKVFEEFGWTGMLKMFVMFNTVGFVMWALYILHLQRLRPSKYKKLPHDEMGRLVRTLASKVGYSPEKIFIDEEDPIPCAHYSNAILSEAITVNRSMALWMGVPQMVAVVAHELGHWKYHHLYYAYCGQLVERTAACFLWTLAYGNVRLPEIFRMEPNVHPIVAELLAYRFFWIPFAEVLRGVCHFINARLETIADEYACQVWNAKHLKEALIGISHLLRPAIHFDSWFSAWFLGYPSLGQRIHRINTYLANENQN